MGSDTLARFQPTAAQEQARKLLASGARNILLYGGSRSGKTFLLLYAVIYRALKAPGTRHCVLRRHFNSVKRSVVMDTFPKVMREAFLGVAYDLNKTDWFVSFPNGSEIWFGGLDDKERVEKILGNEYASMYFNEASEMTYESVTTALTRLAQKCSLTCRAYFDANPPSKRHWLYVWFIQLLDPITRDAVRADMFASMRINPSDNTTNLADGYIDNVLAGLPRAQRRRFLDGEFADDTEGAIWKRAWINSTRVQAAPEGMTRIVIGVDPAVSTNEHSDDTGIVVTGKLGDAYYVLADDTCHESPAGWASAVVRAYRTWSADRVIGEGNNGGDLVRHNILVQDRTIPVTIVHATRGKALRAEPIANLYEMGKVHHVGTGTLDLLEDELCTWNPADSTAASPNRLDALVWALWALSKKAEPGQAENL